MFDGKVLYRKELDSVLAPMKDREWKELGHYEKIPKSLT